MIRLSKASWQPERVTRDKHRGDFWTWENQFETCVGGSHQWLKKLYCKSEGMYTVLNVINEDINWEVEESLSIPTSSVHLQDDITGKAAISMLTTKEPQYSSCQCGKCHMPGSRYSHHEEAELKLIQEGLHHDESGEHWVTRYPYLHTREPRR